MASRSKPSTSADLDAPRSSLHNRSNNTPNRISSSGTSKSPTSSSNTEHTSPEDALGGRSYRAKVKSTRRTELGGECDAAPELEGESCSSYRGSCCESPKSFQVSEETKRCPPAPRKKKTKAMTVPLCNKRRTLISPSPSEIELFFSTLSAQSVAPPITSLP
ncbi:hypothetical protein KP509_36G013900 [Ceratopteris richardii]|uniref:Uncharacterized protein n=1 Tax=Ceratopteris richardii TaxID=49495 RepID=A0A8T2QAN6_CERRI|nr:hypothetical protein KP509_36G013900 [Ceratopteris richardii]